MFLQPFHDWDELKGDCQLSLNFLSGVSTQPYHFVRKKNMGREDTAPKYVIVRKRQYGLNTANEKSGGVWRDVQVHFVRWHAYVRQMVNGSEKMHDGESDEEACDLRTKDTPHRWEVRGSYRPRQTVDSSDDSAPRSEKISDKSRASCGAMTPRKTGAI